VGEGGSRLTFAPSVSGTWCGKLHSRSCRSSARKGRKRLCTTGNQCAGLCTPFTRSHSILTKALAVADQGSSLTLMEYTPQRSSVDSAVDIYGMVNQWKIWGCQAAGASTFQIYFVGRIDLSCSKLGESSCPFSNLRCGSSSRVPNTSVCRPLSGVPGVVSALCFRHSPASHLDLELGEAWHAY
jgi:hypothetical protein